MGGKTLNYLGWRFSRYYEDRNVLALVIGPLVAEIGTVLRDTAMAMTMGMRDRPAKSSTKTHLSIPTRLSIYSAHDVTVLALIYALRHAPCNKNKGNRNRDSDGGEEFMDLTPPFSWGISGPDENIKSPIDTTSAAEHYHPPPFSASPPSPDCGWWWPPYGSTLVFELLYPSNDSSSSSSSSTIDNSNNFRVRVKLATPPPPWQQSSTVATPDDEDKDKIYHNISKPGIRMVPVVSQPLTLAEFSQLTRSD